MHILRESHLQKGEGNHMHVYIRLQTESSLLPQPLVNLTNFGYFVQSLWVSSSKGFYIIWGSNLLMGFRDCMIVGFTTTCTIGPYHH